MPGVWRRLQLPMEVGRRCAVCASGEIGKNGRSEVDKRMCGRLNKKVCGKFGGLLGVHPTKGR
jgi:hypothetical protein